MNEIKAGLLGIKDRLQGFTTVGGLNLDLNPNEIITGAADPSYHGLDRIRDHRGRVRPDLMAARDTQAQSMVVQFAFGDCEPKGINYTPELIPLSNPNAYLLPIGYLATESVTSVLANNAYVLKGDACKCESQGTCTACRPRRARRGWGCPSPT